LGQKGKFLMDHGDAQLARGERVGRMHWFAIKLDFAFVGDINTGKNLPKVLCRRRFHPPARGNCRARCQS